MKRRIVAGARPWIGHVHVVTDERRNRLGRLRWEAQPFEHVAAHRFPVDLMAVEVRALFGARLCDVVQKRSKANHRIAGRSCIKRRERMAPHVKTMPTVLRDAVTLKQLGPDVLEHARLRQERKADRWTLRARGA